MNSSGLVSLKQFKGLKKQMVLGNHNIMSVEIPEQNILQCIGKTSEEHKISKRLNKRIKRASEEIGRLIQAKAVYNIVPLKRKNGTIILNDSISLHSKKLSYSLGSCHKAAVFVTTIGSAVEPVIQQNMKNRPHFGFLLDAAASVAADSAAQYVQDYIDENLALEENLTMRYSPGYCDWPLEEQEKIFRILPKETIGVSLTENYFMSPRKSVSGVIGICSSDSPESSGNACLICNESNCPYRRTQKSPVHE